MVSWTADKDAVLLYGIIEFMNISVGNKELLEHLAGKIGEGCTPKAVSHRLNNIKSKTKGGSAGAAATPKGTPSKGSVSKTPSSSARGRGRGKPPANDAAGVDSILSPSIGRKRAMKPKDSSSDESDESQVKKTKK